MIFQDTMAVDMLCRTATVGPTKVGQPIPADQFEELVRALKDALGPSSGLTCDDVDVNSLTRLMKDYDCADGTWSRYAFGEATRGYTRNLVDEGNGKSNLVSPFAHADLS